MKEAVGFLRSRVFLINVIIAIAVMAVLFGVTYLWLDSYTRHGETVAVPDVRGMQMKQIETIISERHLQFAIVDTVFVAEQQPWCITEQDPPPNAKVKENRTIYLTLNSGIPPKVQMPNLIDVSLRQAEAILQTYGLVPGEYSYRHDLAMNAVLEQKFRGRDIKPGTLISKASVVDLVLGDGIGTLKVEVPDLTGQTKVEALFVLKGYSLSIGAVIYDKTVRDSSVAIIYRQFPLPSDTVSVNEGEAIDIYLTQKSTKVPD